MSAPTISVTDFQTNNHHHFKTMLSMKTAKLLLFCSLFLLSGAAFAQVSCYNIVGYYPSWVAGGNYYINSPSKVDYSKYTHICYAFAIPGTDGKIGSVDNGSVLTDLVNRGHANNVKVLLSIGGWLSSSPNNTPFEAISTNTTAINNLANACASLITQYNLDGIDLDWEYPTTKARWNALATALGTKIHGMGKIFTAAVSESASNNGDHYDDVTMLDLVNIMCYGSDNLASSSIAYWTSRGVPQSKRMLGVPFYSGDNNSAEHIRKANLAKSTAGGIMIWDIASEYGDINAIYSTLGNVCKGGTPVPQTPYTGTPAAIPGQIEAENYDNGGEGVAYHDLTSDNRGGAYRTSEAVDIESCTEGGYNLGYVQAGEWVEYTVKVNTAGVYTLQARVATNAAGKSFHVEMDGQTIGNIAIPNTGDWQAWTTVSVTTPALSTGTKVMRIVVDNAEFNLNWLSFSLQAENIALNKTITASSVEVAGFEPYKAFDGNATSTRWSSAYTDNEWIEADLGSLRNIERVVLKWENAYAASYRIETSTDNQNWTAAKTVTNGAGGTEDLSFPVVSARYIRMLGVQRATPYGYSLWEFEVYPASPALAAARQVMAANPAQGGLDISSKTKPFTMGVRPNPASDVLTLRFEGAAPQGILRIFSISGRQVYQSKVSANASQVQVNISAWPKGIYIVSFGDTRKKVVVE